MTDDALRFDWIAPDKLAGVWGLVRNGLVKVMEHASERWIPEIGRAHV